MGLDTTHNAWHGSYTGFSRWRTAVANAAGCPWAWTTTTPSPRAVSPTCQPLDEVYTVDGETDIVRWSEHYDNSVWLGQWDNDPEDVIDVLLMHSDCEGIIPWRFTQPLADRLTDLLPMTWATRTSRRVRR